LTNKGGGYNTHNRRKKIICLPFQSVAGLSGLTTKSCLYREKENILFLVNPPSEDSEGTGIKNQGERR